MTVTWSGTAAAAEQECVDPAAAASELFERHRRRVLAFCRTRTRNASDAEDATQTTFMYALTGLQRGVVPEFEIAWLLRIADNVCHSMRRRAYRRYEREEVPADLLGDSNGDPAVVADRLATIADALETLPETQRRAIILREWRGLCYEDIAERLDTSHAAVETLLFRARRSLAKQVASIGTAVLHLPYVSNLLRWLLSSGAGKAIAVTAAAVTLGAGVPSDVPAAREGAPGGDDRPVRARYEPAPVAQPRRSALPAVQDRHHPAAPVPVMPSPSVPPTAPAAAVGMTVEPRSPDRIHPVAEPPPGPAASAPVPEAEVGVPALPPRQALVEIEPLVGVEVPQTAVGTPIEQLVPPAVTEVVSENLPAIVDEVSDTVPEVRDEMSDTVPEVSILESPKPATLSPSVPPLPPPVAELPQ